MPTFIILFTHIMKKYLSIVVTAMTILSLGCFTSCQDEDYGVSTAVLKEKAFEQSFIKEFGQPAADQSWDFYALKMQSLRQEADLTRGTQAIEVLIDTTISQSTDPAIVTTYETYGYALEELVNNSLVGQNNYTLTSTGDFKIYAVRYAGGIEINKDYCLDVGIAYYENGVRVLKHLFAWGYRPGYSGTDNYDGDNRYGNPGWAADVKIPKGQNFHFYLKYSYPFPDGKMNNQGETIPAHRQEQIFYSNESPTFIQIDGTPQVFSDYGGTSTLLYSSERFDDVSGKDEQIMMIGMEDAWGHGPYGGTAVGNGTKAGWFDKDFNDVVLLIEGELPIPTSKRFFCEDKSSYDWDYNDVVFDVSNTGIVLRAVGGTLPVWLRVTDRTGHVETYGELHTLMRSLQTDNKKTKPNTYTRLDENGVEQTYYKPIDVAGWQTYHDFPGIWLDPVQIVQWTRTGDAVGNNFTRLDEDNNELERFANPFVTNPVGGLELIVGSEFNQTLAQALAQAEQPNNGIWANGVEKRATIVPLADMGGIPAIWSGPVSVNWMRELQKITLGYPGFYGANIPEGGNEPQWWLTSHEDYLYFFKNDEKNDDE